MKYGGIRTNDGIVNRDVIVCFIYIYTLLVSPKWQKGKIFHSVYGNSSLSGGDMCMYM